jgi:hypothetical protein
MGTVPCDSHQATPIAPLSSCRTDSSQLRTAGHAGVDRLSGVGDRTCMVESVANLHLHGLL